MLEGNGKKESKRTKKNKGQGKEKKKKAKRNNKVSCTM